METVEIEVVYGTPEKQCIKKLAMRQGSTVADAVSQAAFEEEFPGMLVEQVGIWNRRAKLDDVLSDGDRVEIYRPLIADPKLLRRKKAEMAKQEEKD